MLVTTKYLLDLAEKDGGYAVPAMNCYNMENVIGAIQAAEEKRSPLIIQGYSRLFTIGEGPYIGGVVTSAAQNASVPVAFHLDHGAGEFEVQRALRAGCTGIMIDGSTLPYEENAALTAGIVKACDAVGVPVEGELGHVGVAADGVGTNYTEVADAVKFVNETGVAALAVMIGTAHGKYKQAPVLAIDRIKELHDAVDAHLVMHGGSGVPDDQIKAAIKAGIRKINFSTDLCLAFLDTVLATSRDLIAVDKFMLEPIRAVKEFVESKIELLGSEGKA